MRKEPTDNGTEWIARRRAAGKPTGKSREIKKRDFQAPTPKAELGDFTGPEFGDLIAQTCDAIQEKFKAGGHYDQLALRTSPAQFSVKSRNSPRLILDKDAYYAELRFDLRRSPLDALEKLAEANQKCHDTITKRAKEVGAQAYYPNTTASRAREVCHFLHIFYDEMETVLNHEAKKDDPAAMHIGSSFIEPARKTVKDIKKILDHTTNQLRGHKNGGGHEPNVAALLQEAIGEAHRQSGGRRY